MRSCPADFARLAGYLGFSCDDSSLVRLRNPLTLTDWTLPVVEVLMVTGAVLALIFAVRRWRREGDLTGVALWLASAVYALVIELPRYSPEMFSSQRFGIVLVHNVFTVDILDDRLPLYVLALYPATVTLAFDVVRAVGVFERRGALVASVCVGSVHGCIYGVFDHLGPQLRWWVWNSGNPLNHPMLGCVPVSSMVSLALLGPAVIGLLVYVLVTHPAEAGARRRSMIWRIPAICVLAPTLTGVLSLPAWLAAPHIVAQSVVLTLEIVMFAVVAMPTLIQQWRITRRVGTQYPSPYVRVFGVLYLLTFTVLWVAVLPDFAGAIDGVTGAGTPTASLPWAALCFVIAGYCVAGVSSLTALHTPDTATPL
ncbi:hypothetical protein [Mycobacterium sp. OTB74]|jgi:hypothetical protein|uniref:hypothetical protein n=1 Tax=Mycobacterium sp. OTB74 TaxID=1853452 RepID=UPI002474F1D0|nr:hypothetical protein [Mycobacterium sp. OTB74]MDH6242945.1 hypothetical protein [Mycobacterium sp. OTB74]